MPRGAIVSSLKLGLGLLACVVFVACEPHDTVSEGGPASAPVPIPEAPDPQVVRPGRQPNFVFVLIDTLRADHVGSYGYDRETTPFIDSLAREGLVFENAIAQAPWTGASMASIWTSRYPSEVGAGVLPDESGMRLLGTTGSTKIRSGIPTVHQELKKAGYGTYAFVANAFAGGVFGLLRGYDVARQRRMDAGSLTTAAIRVIESELADGSGEPFFLYLHYIDAHEPTYPPAEYRERFPVEDGLPHTMAHARWNFAQGRDPDAAPFRSFYDHKIALYDASIRFIDAQVERLANRIEALGVLENTVFVIASDHGEEFWEHTEFEAEQHLDSRDVVGIGHGQSLFGELTDVPLILSGAGVPAGRISTVVRNVDVAPTIYRLAGIDWSGLELRGSDLIELSAGEATDLDAFSESLAYGLEAKSFERNGWKLIRYSDTKSAQNEFLYDRNGDPGEMRDLSADRPEIAASLGEALDATLAGMDTIRGANANLDEKTREQLKAIGYLE